MSVFEIEGVAKREVPCDLANIKITFRSGGTNAYDVSKMVMEDCDGFLEEISKAGMDVKNIRYGMDSVDQTGYNARDDLYAERELNIRIPFDMKSINQIQSILQKGKYDYELDVNADVSNRNEIQIELAKEALCNSRKEAEKLAEVLGIKVKGVKSIHKNNWDGAYEIRECCAGFGAGSRGPSRASDNLGAKTIEESVNLHVKWILE